MYQERTDWVDTPKPPAKPGETPVKSADILRWERAHAEAHEQLDGRLSEAALNATYGPYLNLDKLNLGAGQDAAPIINAYLASDLGGRYKRVCGEVTILSPIVSPSRRVVNLLDLSYRLPPGTNGNMLVNRATVENRRFNDAQMLAGSTTLNSATAKFSAAQHGGKRIVVQGAGAAGGNLITTVASVQSATAVTLADPAVTAVDGQYAYIGTRDYDITVVGGNPIRDTDNSLRDGPKGLYGYSSNSIRFRHVDRLSIQDVHGETYSGKYFVIVGDATGVDIMRIEAEHTNSDVVHVNGPARDIRIRDIYSRGAGDDIVSLTGGDFQVADTMGDCNGSITDVVVDTIRAHPSIHNIVGATGGRGVLVLAGQTLSQAHKFEASRVTIRNVNTALKGSPIFLGGDTQDVATSLGTYRDILVDGVVNEPVGEAPYQLVTIKDGDFGTVELRSVRGTGSARKALIGANTNVDVLRTIGMKRSDISDNGTVKKWDPIGVPAYGAPTSPSGVRAQTMDRRLAGVPIEMTSGTLFLSYMTIDEVAALVSIRNAVITGTDGATLAKASFFGVNADGTLTRLAQSGSSTTVWNAAASGQSKTLNMQGGTAAVSPFKQFAVGLLYVGPTPPTLAGCKAGNATEAGSDDILGKVVTGLTDIPATIAKSSLLDPPGGALIYSRVW